ncbi:MAG: hypothetical protein FGM58_02030 [Acidimicrobiia bacterium]|nr:hypothetical protein [Acidimicrobiia bacterium]
MFRIPPLARLAAAAVLTVSALALGVAPAGAGSSTPADAPTGGFTDNLNGTVTVTYSGLTSPWVYMYADGTTCTDPAGGTPAQPLARLGGEYPVAASPATIGVTTNVYDFASPVAAPGSPLPAGMYSWCLFDMSSPGAYYLIASGGSIPVYPPITGSMVDNGDGTLTLTYANASNDYSQELFLFVLAAGSTCPPDLTTATSLTNFYVLSSQDSFALFAPLPASPVVVGPGTNMAKFTSITEVPSAAVLPLTSFQACLFLTTLIEGGGTDILLAQSLAIAPGVAPQPPVYTG